MKSNYSIIKRTLDIGAALFGLVLTSPILILTALAIRIESRGAVLYSSKRVGQNYKIFDLLKFRSMRLDADKETALMKSLNQYNTGNTEAEEASECPFCEALGHSCSQILFGDQGRICENMYLLEKHRQKSPAFNKIVDDPRITRVGKFIRKTSIDELPQLFNILRGDMSLIGNRPLPLYEAEKLTTDQAIARFIAPAGLTGLWQVTKRGKVQVSEKARIELDNTYTDQWSFKTDLKIFLKTFRALIQSENV